jgi:hypothetical protein
MDKLDYKKAYRNLYAPGTAPAIIDVPPMHFITVQGKGDPNDAGGAYQRGIDVLYTLSYTIKMMKMGKQIPEDYFEYVVPPLEGFWWMEGQTGIDFHHKEQFSWISAIRQPEFVTPEIFERARQQAAIKKPDVDVLTAQFISFTEGLCVQCMHIGPYDDEPATVEKMERFAVQSGYLEDFSDTRRHHEIYLSDPRKSAPDKRKTILRHPVRKVPV